MPDPDAIAMSQPSPTAPALSAASDMPVVEISSAPDDNQSAKDKPVEPVEGEQQDQHQDASDAADKPRKNRPTVAEIAKQRERTRQADARAVAAEQRLAAAEARLAELTKPPAPEMPKREDFDDPAAYDKALIEFGKKQGSEETASQLTQRQQQEAVEAEIRAAQETFQQATARFAETHPDFDEVFSDDLPITMQMAGAMMAAEGVAGNGAEIAYHLGHNPEECARIASLAPRAQIQAIHKLSFDLAMASARPAERAPRTEPKPTPIRPVGQRAGAGETAPEDMSMADYAAYRNAQIRGANGHATTQ